MPFQAILVSKDEEAVSILTPILSRFGITPKNCGYAEALCLLAEQNFDAVVVDFDDPHSAALALRACSQATSGPKTVTIALLSDKTRVRKAFGEGANFVLYKPLSPLHAEAGLRAATALIKRERRGSYRVPVQIPARVLVQDGSIIEGILLDLSEDGMDLLSERPPEPGTGLNARFCLPGSDSESEFPGEVAWVNPNGQCGVRFVDLLEELRAQLKAWVQIHAAELPPDPDPVAQCKLTDLTLGACYVETESPFPERAGVVLCLRAAGMEVRAKGVVRIMHPTHGMGIEFEARTAEQREQVTQFIEFLTSRPGTVPELLVSPGPLQSDAPGHPANHSDGEIEDSLLDLLLHHPDLTQEQFLKHLREQRGTPEMASS
jgi:CheY-like chemotaxis protein